MYHTLLIEAEKIYTTVGLEDVKLFLTAIYSKPLPMRGDSVNVTFGIKHKREIVLDRNYDRRLQHINLGIILSLSYELILKVFSSMLSEKKIIFLSSKLSLLTSTIQAFETLLYPFNWPHTFIPVLPSYLIDMCDAPTPYIVGLMKTCKHELLAKYKGKRFWTTQLRAYHKLLHKLEYWNAINIKSAHLFNKQRIIDIILNDFLNELWTFKWIVGATRFLKCRFL